MSTAPLPSRVSGHDVLLSSVEIYRILTTLLDGTHLSARLLEELIAFYLENYRLRTKNEDAVQVDLQIKQGKPSTAGTRNSIKVYRGDYTFTDGDLATELCQAKLIREATPSTGNIARDFLSEMLVLNSLPFAQCSVCDETCYKGVVLCHHCIVSTKLNLNQNCGVGGRSSRRGSNIPAAGGQNDSPLFLRPTCLACRNRYRCPAYKHMATTRSGSLCKQIIMLYRFSFEALSLLLHLAVESYSSQSVDRSRDLLRTNITSNTCRMLQKCPRLHDLIEMYGVKKSVMKSWERHVDSNFVDDGEEVVANVVCAHQNNSAAASADVLPNTTSKRYTRRFKFVSKETKESQPIIHQYVGNDLYSTEAPLRPAASIMRADASWIYCCLAVASSCPPTAVDPDNPEPRYT